MSNISVSKSSDMRLKEKVEKSDNDNDEIQF